MKTFIEWVNENALLDKFDYEAYFDNALHYKRSQMPQIDFEHLDDVLMHLSSKYKVTKLRKKLSELLPTQCEVNVDKIKSKLNDFSIDGLKFVTSKDFHIADGHHSHICGLVTNPDAEVVVYRTNLDIQKLLKVLNALKVTTKENL